MAKEKKSSPNFGTNIRKLGKQIKIWKIYPKTWKAFGKFGGFGQFFQNLRKFAKKLGNQILKIRFPEAKSTFPSMIPITTFHSTFSFQTKPETHLNQLKLFLCS